METGPLELERWSDYGGSVGEEKMEKDWTEFLSIETGFQAMVDLEWNGNKSMNESISFMQRDC